MNRGELAANLAISRPTVTGLVEDLKSLGWAQEVDRHLFAEEARQRSGLGRPDTLIRLTRGAGYVAAIHAGHTTVRALVAGNEGVIGTPDRRTDLDVDAAGAGALAAGLEMIAERLRDDGVGIEMLRAISVGVPGPVDKRTGSISSSSFLKSWTQNDLREVVVDLLREEVGSSARLPQVFVENEANAMARGVLVRGLADAPKNFLLLKISDGIGAGLVLDGRVFSGATGGAGEFGHLKAADRAEASILCPRCLQVGCIETVASAGAIVRRLAKLPAYGPEMLPSEMIKNARDPVRHPECHRAIVEAGRQIGEVLAGIVSFLDLETIVVAGVLADAGDLLLDPMREVLSRQGLNFAEPRIVGLDRGARAEAGLYGGVAFALSEAKPIFMGHFEEE